MYKEVRFKDLTPEERSLRFKLSFVDDIEMTYSDYDEETKRYVETEQYKRDKERWGWNNPHLRFKSYPSPEYKPWLHTMWAYFSEVKEMGEVQADDANDAPYSCNCSSPYDTNGNKEITVLKVPFSVPLVGWKLEVKYPNSWPILNEPWCMDDINLGCIPWVWARTHYYPRRTNKGVSILAGDSPEVFLQKLEEIWNLWSDVTTIKVVGDHPWTFPKEGNEGEWWEIEVEGSSSYFTLRDEFPRILELYQFDNLHDQWETCWEGCERDLPRKATKSKDFTVEELLDKIKKYPINLV
jgi:hypothetical protein